MAFLFGKDAKLYYDATQLKQSNSDADTMIWTEIDNVRDVNGNFDSETVDTTTRRTAQDGWRSEAYTLKSGEITFNMPWLKADTPFSDLKDAWLNTTEIALLMANGDITDSAGGWEGLAANFMVQFTLAQPVADIQSVDVTATISSYPEWWVTQPS